MSFLVHTIGAGRKAVAFAVGLRWVVLESAGSNQKRLRLLGGSSNSKIRTQGNVIGASRYTLNPDEPGVCGFFNDPSSLSKSDKYSAIYSLSALFASTLKQGGMSIGSSILMMQPTTMPEKRILIIVEDGLIAVDAIYDQAKAVDEVNARFKHYPDTHLYAQMDEVAFPATPISWDDFTGLSPKKDRHALLKPLPTPAWLPVMLVLGVAAASAIVGYQKLVVEPESQRKALLETQKQDRTPAYVLAVDQELSSAGWERSDFLEYMTAMRASPVLLKGWKLHQVSCDQKQCTFKWDRLGGTVDELAKALPEQTVVYRDSSLEKTVTTRPTKSMSTQWSRSKLLDYQASLAEIRPTLQKLTNAGISTTVSEPQRWAGVDLSGVRPDSLLAKYSVEIGAPLHLIKGVVDVLPESILIKSFVLAISDNDVRMSLHGAVYVK